MVMVKLTQKILRGSWRILLRTTPMIESFSRNTGGLCLDCGVLAYRFTHRVAMKTANLCFRCVMCSGECLQNAYRRTGAEH